MRNIVLGSTGITTPQNGLGCLPIQRRDMDESVRILRRAFEGGITFFDTARHYSDSEEKIGNALSDVRDKIFLATKSMGRKPEDVRKDLETSLKTLKTDYIDIYQFHWSFECYRPGDGTGMYEAMEDFKRQGLIRHIGITTHQVSVATEAVNSGLYETIQYPFSYISSQKEIDLVNLCREKNVGFIAMKGLSGGMINNSRAAYAFMGQFDNVLPIWGVQHMSELEEWISYMKDTPVMDDSIRAIIEKDRKEVGTEFCRGCGYCMPCPQGIVIRECARLSQMIRRSPVKNFFSEQYQEQMRQVEKCVECGACRKKCPYGLDIPNLLKKNYADYKEILAGRVKVI